jgi:hypothetical protein
MSDDEIQRFDVPVGRRRLIDIYRAMRNYFERVAAARGESLDPSWYEDGPDDMPHLHGDQGRDTGGQP